MRSAALGDNASLSVDSLRARRHMARLLAMLASPPDWLRDKPGEVAEWLKAADCKSARASVRWFESSPLHHNLRQAGVLTCGIALTKVNGEVAQIR